MLNIFYQRKITFSRKCLSVILPLPLRRQRPERGTTSDTKAEVITGVCSFPLGPQPQAVKQRRMLFCGVPLSRTGMVKTFIACWVTLMPILWLKKADFCGAFFFPSATVGVSVQVSSEVMSGYMRKKTKITNRETCFNTRKFLQSYEPSQTTFITSRFRAFCQKFCEFFPIFYFFFMCL